MSEGTLSIYYPDIEVDTGTAAQVLADIATAMAGGNFTVNAVDIVDTAANIVANFSAILAAFAALPSNSPYSFITFTIEDTPADVVDCLDTLQALVNALPSPYDNPITVPEPPNEGNYNVTLADILYNLELSEGLPYDGDAVWYQSTNNGQPAYDLNFISIFFEGEGSTPTHTVALGALPVTFAQYEDFTGNDGDLLFAINIATDPLADHFLFDFAINDTAQNIVQFFTQQVVDDGNSIQQILQGLKGANVTSITQEEPATADNSAPDFGLGFNVQVALALGDFRQNLSDYGITLNQPSDVVYDLFVQDTAANIEAAASPGPSGTPIVQLIDTHWTTFVSQDASLLFSAQQIDTIANAFVNTEQEPTFDVPDGDYMQVQDSAQQIDQILTAQDINFLAAFGLGNYSNIAPTILSTSGSFEFNVDQVNALADAWEQTKVTVDVPDSDIIAVVDEGSDISDLSADTITNLADMESYAADQYGQSSAETPYAYTSNQGSIFFDLAQTQALIDGYITFENGSPVSSVLVSAPTGDEVVLEDDAATLEGEFLDSSADDFISAIAVLGYNEISSDGPLTIQANIAHDLVNTFGGTSFTIQATDASDDDTGNGSEAPTVTIEDTAENIETFSKDDIETLATMGVEVFQASDTSLVFDADQAAGFAAAYADNDNISIVVPEDDTISLSDDAQAIEDLLDPDTIAALAALNFDVYTSEDASLDFKVLQTSALIENYVSDDGLSVDGVPPTSDLTLSVPQDDEIAVSDTAVAIEQELDSDPQTAAEFVGGLVALKFDEIISQDASLVFNADAAVDLANAYKTDDNLTVSVPEGDTITVADIASQIETLTPSQIADLGDMGVSAIKATDGSLILDTDQALALIPNNITVSAPPGDQVTVQGTVAQVESLEDHNEIDALASLGVTNYIVDDTVDNLVALTQSELDGFKEIGVTQLVIDDAIENLQNLSPEVLAQLEYDESQLGSQNDLGFAISDTAAQIEGLSPQDIAGLSSLGVTSLKATDGDLDLTGAQVNAAANAGIEVGAPAGAFVTLSDTAANIEALTPQQIADAAADGVDYIQSTDANLVLSVDQANALADNFTSFDTEDQQYEAHVLVPDGETITIADSSSAIDDLTPEQINSLSTLGVSELVVNPGESLSLSLDQAEALAENDLAISADAPSVINDTAENIEDVETRSIS